MKIKNLTYGVSFDTFCLLGNIELEVVPENMDKFETFCIDLITNCGIKYFYVNPITEFDNLIYGILKAVQENYSQIVLLDKYPY